MKKLFLFTFLISIFACKESPQQILFNSDRNGNSDIFLMNSDGTNVTPIVSSPYDEWAATYVNPTTITFLRQKRDAIARFNLDINTGEETLIAHPTACILDDKNAVFSRYGDQAYTCNGEIYISKNDENTHQKLELPFSGFSNYLAWSFNGKNILFTSNTSGNNDIYSIDITTKEVKNLTDHPANDERGELSPTGMYLAFSSNRHNSKDQDIYILNLKTNKVENITNSNGYELITRWDVDGKSLLYGSNKDGNWEIYRYLLSDKTALRLTNNDAFDGDPRIQ